MAKAIPISPNQAMIQNVADQAIYTTDFQRRLAIERAVYAYLIGVKRFEPGQATQLITALAIPLAETPERDALQAEHACLLVETEVMYRLFLLTHPENYLSAKQLKAHQFKHTFPALLDACPDSPHG